jgi:synaptobrevin family protein YKT6
MTVALYFLGLYSVQPTSSILLSSITNTSDYSFFTSNTVREYLIFASREIAQRTPVNTRQTLTLETYPFAIHCYSRKDGLVSVAITQLDYPTRPIYHLLTMTMNQYEVRYGSCWKIQLSDTPTSSSEMTDNFNLYQNVQEADKLYAIQTHITEIQGITRANLEKLLQRGENIESLVSRSQDLSNTSKGFYTKSKKLNNCCYRWFGI